MHYYWSILNIAPTNDLKVIKRAYATQLKAHRPEDNAEQFQRVREAYQWACQIGVHYLDDDIEEEYADDDEVEFVDASESDTATDTEFSNADVVANLAQDFPALALILPSVPTHFPMSFEPAPSPNLPLLAQNAHACADIPMAPPFLDSPSPKVDPAAPAPPPNIAYALNTEQTGRRMRSVGQVVTALWTQSQQLKSIPEIQAWLQTQAEYESLQTRPNLEAALGEAFTEETWPWPTVLAVAELLEWGTIGNLVGGALNQSVQLAHLQQRAAITRKPPWHQLLSKSAAAYFLLSPFSWPKTLLSALLPRTQQIDELCDEVGRAGVDPGAVFNPQQTEFQRQLRQLEFNWPRIAYAATRLVGWPLLFSLLFIGVDLFAPLAGLAFGLACFALWAAYVANSLVFRWFWTPSPVGAGAKATWRVFGVTIAVACMSAVLATPTFAMLLAGFLLLAVGKNLATTLASTAASSFVALIIAAALWPTQSHEKFIQILPIALCLAAVSVYFYQRRMSPEKLLSRVRRPPVILKPLAASTSGNFNWWWIIAGIALMRLFTAGR